MAYPAGHKEQVRQRILRSARKLFNREGYEGVSIDQVMAEAGLTRGAFYFHFRSKAQLYSEAIAFVLEEHPANKWIGREWAEGRARAEQIVDAYLGEQHLRGLEDSCPLVTHAAEAARSGAAVQEVVRSVLLALVDVLAISDASAERPARDGLAVASLCVGGLSLARSVGDEQLAIAILAAARSAAHDILIKGCRGGPVHPCPSSPRASRGNDELATEPK